MYLGIVESLIATAIGLVFSIKSSMLGVQIAGSLLCITLNIWVNLFKIEVTLFQMGRRVMHYHNLKVRYNPLRGRITGIDAALTQ